MDSLLRREKYMRSRFRVVILSSDFEWERWKSYFSATERSSAFGLWPSVFGFSSFGSFGGDLEDSPGPKIKDPRPKAKDRIKVSTASLSPPAPPESCV